MKEFKISEEKLKELNAYISELPFKIAQPMFAYLQENLKEIKEEAKKDLPEEE